VGSELVAEAPAAGVNHDAQLAVLVVLEFAKVVPAAQTAQLTDSPIHCLERRVPGIIHGQKIPFGVASLVPESQRTLADNLLKLLAGYRDIPALSDPETDPLH
ncbi:MAG: hypothetical protein V4671_31780, partial [Armatimonadota bacterium]